ncbi:putative DNA base hypermodification protein [Streptomyces sp. NBC_01310]|uniref:nucleotide kinase domain-containing protein n=1 Tax=Streptomyces sp. NBC_01310 TaxID=2903820 RepID=UPI0035B5B79F|nr:putative DNA base hypermodification protein [Streptomyces sp. NBC_01310]
MAPACVYPALGPFLAYQFTIDLNYAAEMPFSEMDFVMPGPGARDGIRKCFGRSADGIEADVIRYMAASQQEHFTRLGLTFDGLKGRPQGGRHAEMPGHEPFDCREQVRFDSPFRVEAPS